LDDCEFPGKAFLFRVNSFIRLYTNSGDYAGDEMGVILKAGKLPIDHDPEGLTDQRLEGMLNQSYRSATQFLAGSEESGCDRSARFFSLPGATHPPVWPRDQADCRKQKHGRTQLHASQGLLHILLVAILQAPSASGAGQPCNSTLWTQFVPSVNCFLSWSTVSPVHFINVIVDTTAQSVLYGLG